MWPTKGNTNLTMISWLIGQIKLQSFFDTWIYDKLPKTEKLCHDYWTQIKQNDTAVFKYIRCTQASTNFTALGAILARHNFPMARKPNLSLPFKCIWDDRNVLRAAVMVRIRKLPIFDFYINTVTYRSTAVHINKTRSKTPPNSAGSFLTESQLILYLLGNWKRIIIFINI